MLVYGKNILVYGKNTLIYGRNIFVYGRNIFVYGEDERGGLIVEKQSQRKIILAVALIAFVVGFVGSKMGWF